ncbi:MAG: DNA-3-methyladenine glycosylase 2 family protein [Solirubrobacteraceae bacterium]|nr:DNA-3-methyladenine glycosylase 2 family protein [Solirubrobacteraceae bacterium]
MRSLVVSSGDPLAGLVHVRESVHPAWPYRLPWAPPDGVMRRRGGVIERIVHEDGQLVLLRAARPDPAGPVVMGSWAETEAVAARALVQWRRSLAVDVDHRPFLEAVWNDPVLGPLVRRRPWLRPGVSYRPREALVAAVTEQLIEYVEALRIQRGIVRLAGVQCERTGLRDSPTPEAILAVAPAQIEALGLSPRRAALLREVCRLLVRGLDLDSADAAVREQSWRRLRAIPGLGAWTLSSLALRGQGYVDASPSGDLGLLKSVGRLIHEGVVTDLTPAHSGSYDHAPQHGREAAPRERDRLGRTPLATEQQVHELVSRYAPWRGYAAWHLFMA